jgi:predicted MFS family arabinose efflux permease
VIFIPLLQAAVLFFGLSQGPIAAATFFMLMGVAFYGISYLFDLFVEGAMQSEAETGGARSIFLTAMHFAFFIGVLSIGLFIVNDSFAPIYAFSAVALLPVFALTLTKVHNLPTTHPARNPLISAFRTMWRCRKDTRYVIGARFLISLFGVWITIYAPLYLFEQVGLSWQAIGFLIAMALIPFLVLQIPLGVLADHVFGEKEIMIIGFVIMSVAMASLALIPVSLIALWAIAFIVMRIGVAMAEIGTETHFFKMVNESDVSLISLFRMTNPLALLIGPIVALIFLPFMGLDDIFLVFGILLFLGVPLSLAITDSR